MQIRPSISSLNSECWVKPFEAETGLSLYCTVNYKQELNYPSKDIFKKTTFSCLEVQMEGRENNDYYLKLMSTVSVI